jgi:UDP-N-acetylmuramoylalanine--D-glutamate ligase
VCEKNGVTFYNDSKATNTASTISALNTIKNPTVLILGGSEKGENYDALFDKIKQSSVKHVILTGASRFNMLDSAGRVGVANVTVTEDFFFAIKIATVIATDGDAVLLSPACASFDKFSGFEERGDAFIKTVREFCGEESVT